MAGRVDAYQRRHRWAGLPLAVVYKFVDDQGAYLTALITYYGFVSLFPLLLLLVTGLGFALQGSPGLQQRVLDSALAQFPVIGDQIGANIHSFHGSVLALVTGVAGSLYGGLGVVQAVQNALNKIWGVPRNSRPNPIAARVRSLALLAVGGGVILATTLLSAVTASGGVFGAGVRAGAIVVAVAINVVLFTVAFRVLTARPLTVAQVRLWPRSLLTPFTDNVELTAGDRRAYSSYAETERHKGFENVDVDFDPRAGDDTPD